MGQTLDAVGVHKKVYKRLGGGKGVFTREVRLELALQGWAGFWIG